MTANKKFFLCEVCGNLVGLIREGGGELVCCNQPMKELKPNTVDAASEKHVPALSLDGNILNVQVGSTLHPMTEEHWIEWICVSDGNHTHRVKLNPGEEPKASFTVDPKSNLVVYAYCNLHGLWSASK